MGKYLVPPACYAGDANIPSASSFLSGRMRTEIPQLAEMNLGTGIIVTSAGFSSFSVEIAACVDSKVRR